MQATATPLKQIYLLREGQTADNYQDPNTLRWTTATAAPTGRAADKLLSPHAIEQANATGRALSRWKIDAIYVAPHWQCLDTMERILEHLGMHGRHQGMMNVDYALGTWEDPWYFSTGVKSKDCRESDPRYPAPLQILTSHFSRIDAAFKPTLCRRETVWDKSDWTRDDNDNPVPPTHFANDPDVLLEMPYFLLRIMKFLNNILSNPESVESVLICAPVPVLSAIAAILQTSAPTSPSTIWRSENKKSRRAWEIDNLKKLTTLMKGRIYWHNIRTDNLSISRYSLKGSTDWELTMDGEERHLLPEFEMGRALHLHCESRWQPRYIPDPIGLEFNHIRVAILRPFTVLHGFYHSKRDHFMYNYYGLHWSFFGVMWFAHLLIVTLTYWELGRIISSSNKADHDLLFTRAVPAFQVTIHIMLFMYPPLLSTQPISAPIMSSNTFVKR